VKYNYMCRLHIHQQFSRIIQKMYMFNIKMVAILNMLTYRKKNRIKGLIIPVCKLTAKRCVQASIRK